ncbi:hypothetical protein GCM10007940_00490 [Portibacter lacus]|uniref:Type 1 periplasmic binding fold superfamily protein n=2 Tax=Portibacter lacus TaxID=1099794 RepID=A0AA37WCZ8_9BACT|nr:hypothetical protein GCM10007940_00490 [Portibacter lacus]
MISCEKDDPIIPNEEEVITTLIYTLTPENGGDPVVMSFIDLDGDGGDAPTITAQPLASNTTYNGVLELLNEQETPAESITEEISEEANDHQFFFDTDVEGLTVTYSDEDSDGNPLGLATKLTTSSVQSGSLTITLRHEADKSASGVKDGEIANAGGETDIEVTFDVEIN